MEQNAALVAEALRNADRDRYLAILYAPPPARRSLTALHAFDVEIGSIRDRVREALPAEIRVQWWRDAIAAASGGGATGNPLADELIHAIDTHRLPRAAFDAYLEARIFDLYDDPMPSRTDLEGYCGETASAVIQLAVLVLDAAQASDVSELAGHAGCALAIIGLLTLLPKHRRRGQCYVPRDILAAAGTTPEAFLKEHDAAAERAVTAMIALASEHLAAFEKGAGALDPQLRPAFLRLGLARARLDRLRKRPAGELLTGTDEMAGWRRQWVLFRTASRGWPRG